ncbi:MAG: family 10 glycosylhydrolase [Microscillaceae bacterium]|nr:family 10 glycosylhydrolase [Microscillaceae bacterium]MDW8460366.1 family 10 glycosylhydrolase [Cytophagales bacterium]
MYSLNTYKYLILLNICFVAFLFYSCENNLSIYNNKNNSKYLYPKREFRGVWISTLDYKDFPPRKNMNSQEQQQELKRMIAEYYKNGINAIVFQVRSMADAFYVSEFVPTSRYLSGKEGQKSEYDPLALAIYEAHKYNMELHAWFNPYRAVLHTKKTKIDSTHITFQKPEWFIEYRESKHFNPALPEVRAYLIKVVMEVVKKYDIDGVQFDDYFYPYIVPEVPFPDEKEFAQYGKGFSNIHDWRRHNIDVFIQAISDSIRLVKPWVKFGISPLGIWRNKSLDANGSNTFLEHTSYDNLYADILKWAKQGWIDYIAPQLYWSINHPKADYKVLLDWWAKQNLGIHIYIGHGFYKIDNDTDKNWNYPSELPNQIRLLRKESTLLGSIFFRGKFFLQNPCGITDTLRNKFYLYKALLPAMPWKSPQVLVSPFNLQIKDTETHRSFEWDVPQGTHYFVIYRYNKNTSFDQENSEFLWRIQKENKLTIKLIDTMQYKFAVSACDRLHNESKALLLSK